MLNSSKYPPSGDYTLWEILPVVTRALLPPRMADRTLFTSAHVEYLAAVIFYLLA